MFSHPCEDLFAGSYGSLLSGGNFREDPGHSGWEITGRFAHLESQAKRRERQDINRAAKWTFWTEITEGRKIVFNRHCSPLSATCNADSSHPMSGNEPSSGKRGEISLPLRVAFSSDTSVLGRLFLSFPWELLDYETLGLTVAYLRPSQAQQL